jgi:pyridoxal phosphate enzyme (YggS family)
MKMSPPLALQRITEQVREAVPDRAVMVLAVSKGQPASVIREMARAGQRDFAENYLQEALEKQLALGDLPLQWHFIGPLQSNKTKPVALHFNWVHSVDRLKIAERLSEARMEAGLPPLNICLQVNISGEDSKSGLAPYEVGVVARAIRALPGVRLRGLMTIPEPSTDVETQRKPFAALRQLQEGLNAEGAGLDTLSMGMSQDFGAALQEGSTIVRIGTALFGARENRA